VCLRSAEPAKLRDQNKTIHYLINGVMNRLFFCGTATKRASCSGKVAEKFGMAVKKSYICYTISERINQNLSIQ
jgi:hypothetical protein